MPPSMTYIHAHTSLQQAAGRSTLWTFVQGLIWGLSGGVGLMAWLLFKLLRFRTGEVRARPSEAAAERSRARSFQRSPSLCF